MSSFQLVGAGEGVSVGLGDGLPVGVGDGMAVGLGVGAGCSVLLGVGEGVKLGTGVEVGDADEDDSGTGAVPMDCRLTTGFGCETNELVNSLVVVDALGDKLGTLKVMDDVP